MEVKIYSTPTCPFCKKVKKFMDDNDVKYTNYNVADNQDKAQEMIDKSGQMGVPVIDVDGQLVLGFNKEKLKELLDI
ncbi:MAG: glutaredoxin family protein [Elusimicrobia bacterium]|jgi:glutaredoxin 3|nr:glutaredoxin family protein [Elusimicrobiota bacterium]